MKTSELIELLRGRDPDSEVILTNRENTYWQKIYDGGLVLATRDKTGGPAVQIPVDTGDTI